MCPILDSGERRVFPTGGVRDISEGKGRCDLLPLDVISDDTLNLIEKFKETGNTSYLKRALYESKFFPDIPTMLLEVAKHFEEGNKKYPPDEDGVPNWQKGIPVHCYIDSAVRHYLKQKRGDTDEPHNRAFVWNIMCCIWTYNHKPELIDMPFAKNNKGKEE